MPEAQPALGRLPSGRHHLSREAVAESQRGRLLFAIAHAVAEKGFANTTVADVVERASVSRRTFYEQFQSMEECFLAAFDAGVEVVLGQLAVASADIPTEDWRAVTRSDIETYLQVLSSEPEFAIALHVQVLSAGPAALKRRAEMFALFSARTRSLYKLAKRQEPGLAELPDEAFAMHSGGVDELIRECLRVDGPDDLPKLADPITRTTIALFGGS